MCGGWGKGVKKGSCKEEGSCKEGTPTCRPPRTRSDAAAAPPPPPAPRPPPHRHPTTTSVQCKDAWGGLSTCRAPRAGKCTLHHRPHAVSSPPPTPPCPRTESKLTSSAGCVQQGVPIRVASLRQLPAARCASAPPPAGRAAVRSPVHPPLLGGYSTQLRGAQLDAGQRLCAGAAAASGAPFFPHPPASPQPGPSSSSPSMLLLPGVSASASPMGVGWSNRRCRACARAAADCRWRGGGRGGAGC